MYRPQRIRDPLHNLIEFEASEFENALWDVIQTQAFQRLRRVKQLGFSDFVFPGATHSRFAHSVGVFHTARRLMKVIREYLEPSRFVETKAHEAIAAALVHDLGHGPFSHAFEDVGRRLKLNMARHESVSDSLIRSGEVAQALGVLGSGFANDVANILKNGGQNIYAAVVSSQFDADRLDYMRRDRLMTGTQHSAIDFEWLLANLEVGEVPFGVDGSEVGKIETFVLGPKAIHAAEAYVLGLFQLYPTVYFHKTTRGVEKIFTELMTRVFRMVQDGSSSSTGLPSKHPIVQFAKKPSSVDAALSLDDTVVCGALGLLATAKDASIAELASRLRDRKLYKAIDVRELAGHEIRSKNSSLPPDQLRALVNKVCANTDEKITEWTSAQNSGPPRIMSDIGEREPYKQFQESKGPLNQIRIRTPEGELVDLGERSDVVRAIAPFRLFRLYVCDDDSEARDLVCRLIKEGVGHATGS